MQTATITTIEGSRQRRIVRRSAALLSSTALGVCLCGWVLQAQAAQAQQIPQNPAIVTGTAAGQSFTTAGTDYSHQESGSGAGLSGGAANGWSLTVDTLAQIRGSNGALISAMARGGNAMAVQQGGSGQAYGGSGGNSGVIDFTILAPDNNGSISTLYQVSGAAGAGAIDLRTIGGNGAKGQSPESGSGGAGREGGIAGDINFFARQNALAPAAYNFIYTAAGATAITLNTQGGNGGQGSSTWGEGTGGAGGAGGDGGDVVLANSGLVLTLNTGSHALFAQSVGGNGGLGQTNQGSFNSAEGTSVDLTVGVGGSGGPVGHGGDVSVDNYINADNFPADTSSAPQAKFGNGGVLTAGVAAAGIFAQSVGGGGGNAGSAIGQGGNGTVALNMALGGNATTGSGNDPQYYYPQYMFRDMLKTFNNSNAQNIANTLWDWKDNGFGEWGNVPKLKSIYEGYAGNNDPLAPPPAAAGGLKVSDITIDIGAGRAGGGGGIVNGLNGASLINAGFGEESLVPDRGGNAGISGSVTVTSAGNITTTGAYAHGILAHAASNGGGVIGRADGSGYLLFEINQENLDNSVCSVACGQVNVTVGDSVNSTTQKAGTDTLGYRAQARGRAGWRADAAVRRSRADWLDRL